MAKHFLYLTNDRLISLVWNRGAIKSRESFLAAEAAGPSCVAYMEKYRRLPTYFITDLVEEDFRLDTIPHLRGSDSEAIISRKLGQIYRSSNLRHAVIQGREVEGRRDDKVLYHAVTNTDLIKPWLELLDKIEVPLEGVYSSSVLSARLLKALDLQFPHTLLVTVVPDFGLRQTYFRDQQIKFSRITPIVYDEGQSVGGLIAAEIGRTWQYLESLRYFAGGETLEVCILVHARDKPVIADAIRKYPSLKCQFLDIEQVSTKIGLKKPPSSSHAEQILVHTYAQTGLENHFAEPPLRRFAIFRKARMGLFALTAGILAVGVAGTAFNFHQASQISNQVDARESVARNLQSEYQTIFNAMRQQKLASDVARDTSAFYNTQIRPQPAAPGALLSELSNVLAEFPRVKLLGLTWTIGTKARATPYYTAVPPNGTLEVTSDAKSASVTTPGAVQTEANALNASGNNAQALADPNPVWPSAKLQFAIIDAAITPFDGDFRATLAEVERVKVRLNAVPGFKVSIESMPLDVRSTATINATGKRVGAGLPEARFVLKVVRAGETS
jgi:hypothetical protein